MLNGSLNSALIDHNYLASLIDTVKQIILNPDMIYRDFVFPLCFKGNEYN
jgi:hypothetical protein